ncbi:MAG TPA: hypothetical protein V6D46_10775, partial [Coleofasciculaceae cyanobacterium]
MGRDVMQGVWSLLFLIAASVKGLLSLLQMSITISQFRANASEFREASDSVIARQRRHRSWFGIAQLVALVIPWAGFQWANTSDFIYQWWGWLIWFGTGAIDDWTAFGLYTLEQQRRTT